MPIYEYRCGKCGAHFEKLQKFSDAPLSTCEKCRGRLERLLSPPAIQFKGSGWYVTDYARKSPSVESSKSETPTTPQSKKEAEPSAASGTKATKPASDK